MAKRGTSDIRRELRDRQREWLTEILRLTGRKPAQLAIVANVSESTLTRFLNNPDHPGTLSLMTVDRITKALNVPGPEEIRAAGGSKMLGFSEAERIDLAKEKGDLARVLVALVEDSDALEVWRLRGLSLEGAGYLPGDVLVVDRDLTPKPHDAICAQVTDYAHGSAETVFRIFDPPFLIGGASQRLAYKPLLVDNERVAIKGVVVSSLRPARLSTAR